MWIWIANKFAKFHTKRQPNWKYSKKVLGGYFFEKPYIRAPSFHNMEDKCCMGYQANLQWQQRHWLWMTKTTTSACGGKTTMAKMILSDNDTNTSEHSWMFCYFASSPPGRFATTLDDSLPGRFVTWMIRHLDVLHLWTFWCQNISLPPGRFATCLKLCNLRYCKKFYVVRCRNVQEVSEMSWYRNVQMCETSR